LYLIEGGFFYFSGPGSAEAAAEEAQVFLSGAAAADDAASATSKRGAVSVNGAARRVLRLLNTKKGRGPPDRSARLIEDGYFLVLYQLIR